jgi:penicillin-binding protein 2
MIRESSILRGDLLEYRAQNRWFVMLILLVMALLMGRFFQLQVLGGKKYEKLAEINQVKRTRIPPRRGMVLDRQGRVLAKNVDLYRVSIVPHYVKDIDEVLVWLRSMLYLTEEEVARVKDQYYSYVGHKHKRFRDVTVARYLNGRHCPADGTRLEEVHPTHYQWCPKCGREYIELPESQESCPFDRSKLERSFDGHRGQCTTCDRLFVFGRSCPEDSSPLVPRTHSLRCPRCQKDYTDYAAAVRARLHEVDGVYVREQTVRAYPYDELFGHAVGYVNEVTGDEIKRHPGVYVPGDYVGRRGVERTMEEVLRGKAGEEVTFRDSRGRELLVDGTGTHLANLKYEPAVPGNNVALTLDLEVQRILSDAVKDVHSAGIVVMQAQTGEVIGIYSTPSFDPNDWAGRLTAARKKEYDDNPFYPMINKATTAFPPASTFKIVTALAALNEGIITEETKINCPGYYDYSGHRFGCYNKYGHGDLDLRRGLVASCDVYFYRLGEWLGMDRLEHYSILLGLGRKTGVEIGEDMGLVPSREWHERHSKGGFQPGFTLSTAVGQKDIRATPLQMALVLAQIINGGRALHPFMVDHIEDEHGNMVRSLRKQAGERIGVPDEYLEFLKSAMFETVEADYGTAHNARLESIQVGGKTGTAEALQVKKGVDPYVARWLAEDHAWFIGFAPVQDPKVTVACIVEHGGYGGEKAAPIVGKVIWKLFSRNLVPD